MKKNMRMVVCCLKCSMWFDLKNGLYSVKNDEGKQCCPACGAYVFKDSYMNFIKNNASMGIRMSALTQYEWPMGAFWEKEKGEASKIPTQEELLKALNDVKEAIGEKIPNDIKEGEDNV